MYSYSDIISFTSFKLFNFSKSFLLKYPLFPFLVMYIFDVEFSYNVFSKLSLCFNILVHAYKKVKTTANIISTILVLLFFLET